MDGDGSGHHVGAETRHNVRESVLHVGEVLTQDRRVDHVQRLRVGEAVEQKQYLTFFLENFR